MSDKESEEKKPVVIKNATDLQRLKLEKLMKNPDKPVIIPEGPKTKSLAPPPDFVRNVMGSSAGAGSGEFHVYRHLRRKEYARQKFIQEKSEKEKLEEEYHRKIEENKKNAEEKTAKKRAKRLKKKQKAKMKEKRPKKDNTSDNQKSSQSDTNDDDDSDKDEATECDNSKKADNNL
ncbi:unnamed protein product, partial [Brenthis ino]